MELGMRNNYLGSAILFFIMLQTAAAGNDTGLCKILNCGKGTCNKSSAQSLGIIPVCECNPGWKQPSIGISLSFLPCVIPNCTLSDNCGGKVSSSAPSPVLSPPINSPTDLLNPCKLGASVCREGSCVVESEFGYSCNCREGYENLLNMTAGPCVKPCAIGADCSQLGISVGGNGSGTAAPQYQTDTSKGFMKDSQYLITMAIRLTIPCFLFLLG